MTCLPDGNKLGRRERQLKSLIFSYDIWHLTKNYTAHKNVIKMKTDPTTEIQVKKCFIEKNLQAIQILILMGSLK